MVDDYSTPDIPTKTCTKCGETKPETEFWFHRTKRNPHARRARCKPCEAADHAAYVEANRDEMNAYMRGFRMKNHDRHMTVKRAWTETNRDKVNQQWRERNPGYMARNPEKVQAKTKNMNASRRARLVSAPFNDLSVQQWQEILHCWNSRCAYCGKRSTKLTQDHIVPLASGGSHTASNIVPACLACNRKKYIGRPLKPVQPLMVTVAKPKKTRKT